MSEEDLWTIVIVANCATIVLGIISLIIQVKTR